ncbi:hypothetical protein MO973_19915 [Paenibacillus sp. TRM 82003]|nr:hypothetical protein [Paenibacillus sp. TRM 82003]
MIFAILGIVFAVACAFFCYDFASDYSIFKQKYSLLGAIISAFLTVGLFGYFFTSTTPGERTLKTFQSENSGGLERSVDVYDQQGNLLKTYEGKLDVQENDYGNKVLFDLDGKRIVIYNAIVVVEEQ